jgi:hypothetical protein
VSVANDEMAKKLSMDLVRRARNAVRCDWRVQLLASSPLWTSLASRVEGW